MKTFLAFLMLAFMAMSFAPIDQCVVKNQISTSVGATDVGFDVVNYVDNRVELMTPAPDNYAYVCRDKVMATEKIQLVCNPAPMLNYGNRFTERIIPFTTDLTFEFSHSATTRTQHSGFAMTNKTHRFNLVIYPIPIPYQA